MTAFPVVPADLSRNIASGIVVGIVALPLSLALAVAVGDETVLAVPLAFLLRDRLSQGLTRLEWIALALAGLLATAAPASAAVI